jgi:hypothetical protein
MQKPRSSFLLLMLKKVSWYRFVRLRRSGGAVAQSAAVASHNKQMNLLEDPLGDRKIVWQDPFVHVLNDSVAVAMAAR